MERNTVNWLGSRRVQLIVPIFVFCLFEGVDVALLVITNLFLHLEYKKTPSTFDKIHLVHALDGDL